ncbi:MAG: hypothetical protein K2X93_17765 [Candidatus Obscuribacterales bacterium]|nr:hypothetical protein [Candidatus Obscuribacterales bacterium]
MVSTEDRKLAIPEWCRTEFSAQINSLQSELDRCKEQVKQASERMDYITKIFKFCAQELDGFELSQPESLERVSKILGILGWETEPSSNNNLFQLVDENDTPVLLYVNTDNKPPDRNELGSLLLAQTELWQKTGVEATAVILYAGPAHLDQTLAQFAKKRQISFLPLSTLLRKSAEVLLGELDPDDVRKSVLQSLEGI